MHARSSGTKVSSLRKLPHGAKETKILIDPAAKSVADHKHALYIVFPANVGFLLKVYFIIIIRVSFTIYNLGKKRIICMFEVNVSVTCYTYYNYTFKII